MKNRFAKKLILALLIPFLFIPTSCKKGYFDTVPDNINTIDKVFSNRANTERWFFSLYAGIQDIWDQPYGYQYAGISDELEYANWGTGNALTINSGAVTSDNSPTRFETYYQLIRNINIFLERVDECKELLDQQNGESIVKEYKGEARFLRAYYHWLLMKEVGPAAIAPLVSGLPNNNFQIPRSSWDECVKFVLNEMRASEASLTSLHLTGSNTVDDYQVGRITLPIAAAIEAQILLAHASPLFNGNSEFADWKNFDGKQLFNQTYDPTRWAAAAEAMKRAIDLNVAQGHKLFIKQNANLFLQGFNSTRDMFWDGWKEEGIWLRRATNIQSGWSQHCAPKNSLSGNGWNGIGVLQELVDDFRMADGRTIKETPSYNETTFTNTATPYYSAGTNNMYVGREPRFYVDVTFSGAVIPVVPAAGQTYVTYYSTAASGKKANARDYPKTGYTARKNIHPNTNLSTGSNPARPAMLIRMAELYLSYAEALNESQPGNADVLKYLNDVRTRGGIPAIPADLGQIEMRKQIRLERRIELCYESGLRFWDVRRWKIPDETGSKQGGDFYGMNMDAGTSLSDPTFYKRVVATSRVLWQRKFYFLPYRQNEMDRNKQIVQLPGY
ncbi:MULTISPECIES: RagB/SusD family nutrient uptake outer membrane protein [unclassified Pedobacter]|uniref:RagB/SusD family nutrient uptake outer membrane protein n=1 Tax=unclassified Pedobacter TaxID=2628915 RepID=UPI001424A031|nr:MULTISPECIES: RagB/SusD family nutrient uptake outer membrane protein [unclassified Pedobacter]NII85931.1 hypothetical protein [Pedobacter sp. SG908]NMN39154.1 hypothetical protein [Pedobacter sp. SG918]